jgi:hypothetical protein
VRGDAVRDDDPTRVQHRIAVERDQAVAAQRGELGQPRPRVRRCGGQAGELQGDGDRGPRGAVVAGEEPGDQMQVRLQLGCDGRGQDPGFEDIEARVSGESRDAGSDLPSDLASDPRGGLCGEFPDQRNPCGRERILREAAVRPGRRTASIDRTGDRAQQVVQCARSADDRRALHRLPLVGTAPVSCRLSAPPGPGTASYPDGHVLRRIGVRADPHRPTTPNVPIW